MAGISCMFLCYGCMFLFCQPQFNAFFFFSFRDIMEHKTTEIFYPFLGASNGLKIEEHRLRTFYRYDVNNKKLPRLKLPANITPELLARNGFFYNGGGEDHVVCVYCDVIIGLWEPDDDVSQQHRQHSPTCEFVNIPNIVANVPSSLYKKLLPFWRHAVMSAVANEDTFPTCTTREMRESSVEDHKEWSQKLKQKIVDAGFMGVKYVNSKGRQNGLTYFDSIMCHMCKLGIRGIDEHIEPMEQHVRFSPFCEIVKTLSESERKAIPGVFCLDEKFMDNVLGIDNLANYARESVNVRNVSRFRNSLQHRLIKGDCPFYFDERVAISDASSRDFMREFKTQEVGIIHDAIVLKLKVMTPPKLTDKDSSLVCRICLNEPFCVVFLPCKHLCCCNHCSLMMKNCPFCQSHIEKKFAVIIP